LTLVCAAALTRAQNPMGTLEGQISDPSAAVVSGAQVSVHNLQTGLERTARSSRQGTFHFADLPVGDYTLSVKAQGFEPYSVAARIDIGRVVTIPVQLHIAAAHNAISVTTEGEAVLVDTSQTIGNVVSSKEATDLPLNGRDLTQLGLLQPGVAPMTAGLQEAGGIARSGQAYAVNGQRPESNNYLLDGATNVDSVNGGYALRVPVDAVDEFRILTLNAPAEYGDTMGATTSVVTHSGGNAVHGVAYDFLRNDVFDARNFFADQTEPLHRNQFGGTLGGPIRRNKDFFFVYYEGQRDAEGKTLSAPVPSVNERNGNFSGITDPATGQPFHLFNYFTGQGFPNDQIPSYMISPIAKAALSLYPLPNDGTNYKSTQIGSDDYNQGGFRLDHYFGSNDQLSARFSASSLHALDPLPISGAAVPGFPVTDDINTDSATISEVHLFSAQTVQTARVSFFRNVFFKDQAQNHTPGSSLGFDYQPTLGLNTGIPYLIVSGYASVGNPITGPQDTWQNDYQASYSIALTRGAHNFKFGADLDRQQINVLFGIATNGFFVFAPFPINDSFASFLLGQSVQFFQGGGQFDRGLRKWITAGYAQDEWRITPRLTLNYGLRYEVNTPYTDIRNRLNAWAPGQQSTVMPNAPEGILFPGDKGVPAGIAPVDYHEFMPRVGFAWDPFGGNRTTIRAGYGIFYDGYTNGAGGPLQAAVSALPWTQALQLPGPGFDIANPYGGAAPPFNGNTFVQPSTILTVQSGMLPPYSQNWNFSIERSIGQDYLLDVRYVGTKGTHLPRFIEANPVIYQPGMDAQNPNAYREYTQCNAAGLCDYGSVGLLADESSSTYHALQVAFSRQFTRRMGFTASYWYSKSLDYISTLNVAGSAPTLVAGENDLAQNPFDLRAERGPSLFDATHRFVFSGSYAPPVWHDAARAIGYVVNGWQFNTIVNLSTGTPFTVYDGANVAMQGSAPEITGFYSSRPDLIGDPNNGPQTPEEWFNIHAFQPLNPQTQAGQFGNEGRNVVRGPGIENVDLSVFRYFNIDETRRLQFRAECFNLLNHPNFGLPVNDIESPSFGQILQAGPPRLLQLALKFIF